MILVVSPRQDLVDLVHIVVAGACRIESRDRLGRLTTLLQREDFPLWSIILDARAPANVAPVILDRLLIRMPQVTVIAVIDRGDTRRAVELMRHGALDCIEDPTGAPAIRATLMRTIAYTAERVVPQPTADEAAAARAADALDPFVGPSPALRELRERIARAAESDLPVLITGETGVGKGVVASAIHRLSDRRQRIYADYNIAAVSTALFESELFGTVPGAYTGAARRTGLFERADTGTLFLDEIGELSPEIQPKILAAVEQGRIRPLGTSQPISVDVRLLCATNRDLRRMIARGTFRADLWHRLAGIEIDVPPLRSRPEDISDLVHRLLASDARLAEVVVERDALRVLELYSWPGNVRELKMVLERSVALSGRRVLRRRDLVHDFTATTQGRRRRRRRRGGSAASGAVQSSSRRS